MVTQVVRDLMAELPGVVHVPGDDQYASATSPDNSSYPQNPGAVVGPTSVEELARAVECVARSGGHIVVQSTGHGAGQPVTADDVLVDTSGLDDVTSDADARTARVGAGVMWPAVQKASPPGLLGLSGTSPTVGVLGYTFGGGVGWFVRKYGLASASLRSVDYVDAAGAIRHASDDAADSVDREALWAFRGGAPVGIAGSVEIGLFEVPDLWTGYLLWPAQDAAAVAAAWASATDAVGDSVTSALSLLKLPPRGPFPDELLGTTVVHLSYASLDGGAPLEPMREAVRRAANPVLDTTGSGDVETLSAIHLDPPAAVPARGTGRWLSAGATDLLVAMFDAARVGQPDGLNMIEVRHTDSTSVGPAGAVTTVPAPFLLHAVGAAPDDEARARVDVVLNDVEHAAGPADVGRSAPSFREGQPQPADALPPADRNRVRAVRDAVDPDGRFVFHRHPRPL